MSTVCFQNVKSVLVFNLESLLLDLIDCKNSRDPTRSEKKRIIWKHLQTISRQHLKSEFQNEQICRCLCFIQHKCFFFIFCLWIQVGKFFSQNYTQIPANLKEKSFKPGYLHKLETDLNYKAVILERLRPIWMTLRGSNHWDETLGNSP